MDCACSCCSFAVPAEQKWGAGAGEPAGFAFFVRGFETCANPPPQHRRRPRQTARVLRLTIHNCLRRAAPRAHAAIAGGGDGGGGRRSLISFPSSFTSSGPPTSANHTHMRRAEQLGPLHAQRRSQPGSGGECGGGAAGASPVAVDAPPAADSGAAADAAAAAAASHSTLSIAATSEKGGRASGSSAQQRAISSDSAGGQEAGIAGRWPCTPTAKMICMGENPRQGGSCATHSQSRTPKA